MQESFPDFEKRSRSGLEAEAVVLPNLVRPSARVTFVRGWTGPVVRYFVYWRKESLAGEVIVLLLNNNLYGSARTFSSTLHCLWAFIFDLPMPGTCGAAFLQSAMFLAELESVSASDSQWAVGKDSGSADLPGGVG